MKATVYTISSARPRRYMVRRKSGFTLIELVVVIGVIASAMALAIPSMMAMFSSGADKQAYNLLAAQMTVARAVAIENGTYAGVHVQMDNNTDQYKQDCYSMVMVMNENSGKFEAADGFFPEPMPGKMAFGQVNSRFASGSTYTAGAFDDGTELTDFTTFTIVFSSDGKLAKQISHGGDIIDVKFKTSEAVFSGTGKKKIWNSDAADYDPDGGTTGEQGATVITMFNYTEFIGEDEADRADYLDDYGQFLPTNYYTGQLFQRR